MMITPPYEETMIKWTPLSERELENELKTINSSLMRNVQCQAQKGIRAKFSN